MRRQPQGTGSGQGRALRPCTTCSRPASADSTELRLDVSRRSQLCKAILARSHQSRSERTLMRGL